MAKRGESRAWDARSKVDAGRLSFREVGQPGELYPEWFRELNGKSGVYVIKERGLFFDEIVYVGESHAGRLKKTIARHFQTWQRKKDFWAGFNNGADPGRVYARSNCLVAVVVTRADRAVATQDKLIRRLKPRDNVLAKPLDEEVPF
jgi:hypothetical protein